MADFKKRICALTAGLLGCLCFGGGDWLMVYGDPTYIGKLILFGYDKWFNRCRNELKLMLWEEAI